MSKRKPNGWPEDCGDPYDCQIKFMNKVEEALNSSQNALLESPTGTGKTLSLLCSVLEWQRKYNETVAEANRKTYIKLEYEASDEMGLAPIETKFKPEVTTADKISFGEKESDLTQVIYASRTHTQLTQVVQELKRTGHAPYMTVLGSREQLCIHPKVSKYKGLQLLAECNKQLALKSCKCKNNLKVDDSKGNFPSRLPTDIEDLIKKMKLVDKCPYYISREYTKHAELILLPYNYLLDEDTRKGLNDIKWKNSIVIFDEAHNVDSTACDGASFTCKSGDVAAWGNELKQALQFLHNEVTSGESNILQLYSRSTAKIVDYDTHFLRNKVGRLLQSVRDLEARLDALPLSQSNRGNKPSCTKNGYWIYELFQSIGFTFANKKYDIEYLLLAMTILQTELDKSGASTRVHRLNSLVTMLSKVFRGSRPIDVQDNLKNFEVYLQRESRGNDKLSWTLNFWCFHAGISMSELMGKGVRSIIMTSGTLSPLQDVSSKMGIPFNVTLENDHIVTSKQVSVNVITEGPNQRILNGNFENRDTKEYKDEVGEVILSILRTLQGRAQFQQIPSGTAVDGGVLVFFPSYGVMDNLYNHWKVSGMLNKFKDVIGQILKEETSAAVNKKNDRFGAGGWNNSGIHNNWNKQSIQSGRNQRMTAEDDDTIEERAKSLENEFYRQIDFKDGGKGKCMVFAVCRGKLAEGINFKDRYGRAVIMVGLPFAPAKDPRVVIQKNRLDKSIQTNTGSLSGQAWYTQTAMRAINQAIGRVIRHKKDWGAIFLVDYRYSQPGLTALLSKWVRERIPHRTVKGAVPASLKDTLARFRQFLNDIQNDEELRDAAVEIVDDQRMNKMKEDCSHIGKGSVLGFDIENLPIENENDQISFIKPTLLHMGVNSNSNASYGKRIVSSSSCTVVSKNLRKHNSLDTNADSSQPAKKQTTSATSVTSAAIGSRISNVKPSDVISSEEYNQISEADRVKLDALFSAAKAGGINEIPRLKNFIKKIGKCVQCLGFELTQSFFHKILPLIPVRYSNIYVSLSTKFCQDLQKKELEEKEKQEEMKKNKELRKAEEMMSSIGPLEGGVTWASVLGKKYPSLFHSSDTITTKPNMNPKSNRHTALLGKSGTDTDVKKNTASTSIGSSRDARVPADVSRQRNPTYLDVSGKQAKSVFSSINSTAAIMSRNQKGNNKSSSSSGSSSSSLKSVFGSSSYNTNGQTTVMGSIINNNNNNNTNINHEKRNNSMNRVADVKKKSKVMNLLNKFTNAPGTQNSVNNEVQCKNLSCLICLQVPERPCVSSCGHVCCQQCWYQHLKVMKTCPCCRQEVDESKISKLVLRDDSKSVLNS